MLPIKNSKQYYIFNQEVFDKYTYSAREGASEKVYSLNSCEEYLTMKEYNTIKDAERLLDEPLVLSSKSANYITYLNIEVPYNMFTAIDNSQDIYDFSTCKDFFIMEMDSFKEITILVNEAEAIGYTLVSINEKTVQMRKIKIDKKKGF